MLQKSILSKLLRPGNQKSKMYGAWLALCLGLLLLFLSALAWLDFKSLLKDRNQDDVMAEYILIGKTIDNSGQANLFSEDEINELKGLKNVKDVGSLVANQFPVSASIGGNLGFQTELFLESVDGSFLEDLPENWHWQDGQNTLPIILSNDFLNLYNYGFALSQGLPQLSKKTIQSLPFQIALNNGQEKYNAEIIGFTDRISSILVPKSFITQKNKSLGSGNAEAPARLILKVKDPSESSFVAFLKEKNYNLNADQLKWSKIKTVVQAIISVVGVVAIFIVGMGILSFILFLEVTVYRAEKHIVLLKQLGYLPKHLQKVLIRFFIPWMSSALIAASLLAIIAQGLLMVWLRKMDLQLNFSIAWIIPVLLSFFLLILYLLLRRSTNAILNKI